MRVFPEMIGMDISQWRGKMLPEYEWYYPLHWENRLNKHKRGDPSLL